MNVLFIFRMSIVVRVIIIVLLLRKGFFCCGFSCMVLFFFIFFGFKLFSLWDFRRVRGEVVFV